MKKYVAIAASCILLLIVIYIFLEKKYENHLIKAFNITATKLGIPENKIRKTVLNYYPKGNFYEYYIYIKDVNDDKYFDFSYTLKDSKRKSIILKKIDAELISPGVYYEGSVMELNDKLFKMIIP